MLLQRACKLPTQDVKLQPREFGIQDACRRAHSVAGPALLQDEMGCQQSESQKLRSKSLPCRASSSGREPGDLDGCTFAGASLSQHEAYVRSVQQQIDHFLAGIVSESGTLDGGILTSSRDGRDDDLRCDAVQNSENNLAAIGASSGDPEAARLSSTSSLRLTSSSRLRLTSSLVASSSTQLSAGGNPRGEPR